MDMAMLLSSRALRGSFVTGMVALQPDRRRAPISPRRRLPEKRDVVIATTSFRSDAPSVIS